MLPLVGCQSGAKMVSQSPIESAHRNSYPDWGSVSESQRALQEASSVYERFPLECYNNAAILKLAKRTSQTIYTLANTIKRENDISRTNIQKNNLSSTMAKCLHSSWFLSICRRCFRPSTNTITPWAVFAPSLSPVAVVFFLSCSMWFAVAVHSTEFTKGVKQNSSGEPTTVLAPVRCLSKMSLVLKPGVLSTPFPIRPLHNRLSKSFFIRESLLKSFSADKW